MSSALGASWLRVGEVADFLQVSAKTVRRRISDGSLVARKVGLRMVRVDASSVARLLASEGSGVEDAPRMGERRKPEAPRIEEARLLRQRGRAKEWTGLVDGEEVGLGTSDRKEATTELAEVALSKPDADGRRRDWRVYRDTRRGGFVGKYYDQDGHRRLHRIPATVRTLEEGEEHMALWYAQNVGRGPVSLPSIAIGRVPRTVTFEQFGQLWTSGKLAEIFEDHVRAKATAVDDESRLRLHVYPIIGRFRVTEFEAPRGLELVERVLRTLPTGTGFSKASRRQVLQAIHRLLTLAVYPAKLIGANPLPKGFLPAPGKSRAKTYLYPSEDRRLLGCTLVPVLERLFYGFLAREGLRVSEALDLTWGDVDLEHGVLNLEENKTDDPRTWVLDAGVAEALRRWRGRFGQQPSSSSPIFVDPAGFGIDRYEAARTLRERLRAAGVSRPQLFETSETRMAIRAHDLRASFITVNLALGKTEAWITDRTGHRSSQMIYTYKRAARTLADLKLGGFDLLYEAIPELRDG